MRRTKIICTIGPASREEDTLKQLMQNGMNVARLNFSHGSHADHAETMQRIERLRTELDLPVAVMLDTKGPEYRIQTFENGSVTLQEGNGFRFTLREIIGNEQEVSVNVPEIIQDVQIGDEVLVNNGLIKLRVTDKTATDLICVVLCGGILSDRKSMSFPHRLIQRPFLSEQDKQDLLFGIRHEVDYIACSFVSRKEDILAVKEFLQQNGGEDIELIAKIENQSGVNNLKEIADVCSGIMIARGDLGVEIPFVELPSLQKRIITTCRLMGKRVITATEMLESMIQNQRPTRAEISDVANAIYDGSSAIMLSGETAAGKHPVLALQTMSAIAEETEKHLSYKKNFHRMDFHMKNTMDAISHSVCCMALDLNAKAICVHSCSGMTCRMISRFRPSAPILGMTPYEKSRRRLALSWGVIPVILPEQDDHSAMIQEGLLLAKKVLHLRKGDNVIITSGNLQITGSTNLVQVEPIP